MKSRKMVRHTINGALRANSTLKKVTQSAKEGQHMPQDTQADMKRKVSVHIIDGILYYKLAYTDTYYTDINECLRMKHILEELIK